MQNFRLGSGLVYTQISRIHKFTVVLTHKGNTHAHTCTHTHMHTCMYAHTHTHTHTHTPNGTELIKFLTVEEVGFESGLKNIDSCSISDVKWQ